MKKFIYLSITILGLFLHSTARPIDQETAQAIAAKFMATNDLQLVSTYQTAKNTPALYIFNTSDGFVIVAADDCETPIVAYSHEGHFDPNNVPVQMEEYLQDFVGRIQYAIENHIEADAITARQWELVKTTGRLNEQKNAKSVEPLLTEKWHQGCLYNSLCPTMSGPCNHAELGCVAVAMGQIMHYWKYPTQGFGSHSYNNQGVTLSADFGSTTYDWDHMPDSLTDGSSEAEIMAVATLLYHCGISVDMEYSTNGSGANSIDVPNAMKRYFNYSRRIHREKRADYSDDEWMQLLKNDLDMQRPVLYSGHGNTGGHAFVCDGYDDNGLLHFNLGWGRANGYFALGNLNPIGYDFNETNFAIVDIIPQFEPWLVVATPYPSTAGTIEGVGGYHLGEQCTLTAVPNENCEFLHWKKDGRTISNNPSYSFIISNDVEGIEACFSYKPIKDITARHAPDTSDVNSPYVSLAWNFDGNNGWSLLKQFEANGEQGITTDGEYIFTCKQNSLNENLQLELNKYTMDGDLLESSYIDNIYIQDITCDGNALYCGNTHIYSLYLYCIDFEQNAIVDSINMNVRTKKCAYDAGNDSFWILGEYPNREMNLIDRHGQTIFNGPTYSLNNINHVTGFGSISGEDGNPHLLILSNRHVDDYDISSNSFNPNHSVSLDFVGSASSACIGKYEDKNTLFVIAENHYSGSSSVYIYEINSRLAPILHYRLYRADSEGNMVMLADECTDTSFIDSTWNDALAGMYRFGISEVYYNGTESEIIWSDFIEKTNYGIDENGQEEPSQQIQKVIENGQVIIIKDGKRYSISGQHLN